MKPDGYPHRTPSLALVGAGGEPVSFRATLASHGLAWLPPNRIATDERSLHTTVELADGTARSLEIVEAPAGWIAISVVGRAPSARAASEIVAFVRQMFALDEDLAPLYALVAHDPELAYATVGIGRLLRSPTAFEDVVRTLCTTNCTWSATTRMIAALVDGLGARGPRGSAFPSARRIADADPAFFSGVARMGYRGAYVRALASAVVSGALDLEALRAAPRDALSDAELFAALLALPGVGPYAAAHAMLLFGRASRLVLDSWTRPRYARLVGKKIVADHTIERRFKRYGDDAGRAFWLFLWKARHAGDDFPL